MMEDSNDQYPLTFAQLLTQAMQEHNMTLHDLVNATGTPATRIKSYLRGQCPTFYFCRKICIALDIPAPKILSSLEPHIQEERLDAVLKTFIELPEEDRRTVERILWGLRHYKPLH